MTAPVRPNSADAAPMNGASIFAIGTIRISTYSRMPMPVRLPLSMVIGGLIAAVFGLAVGLPALRLKGDYLAIVTLACGEIIKSIITNLDITGGALGLNTNPIYSNAKKLLPYAIVLVLLIVINVRQSRDEKRREAARRKGAMQP